MGYTTEVDNGTENIPNLTNSDNKSPHTFSDCDKYPSVFTSQKGAKIAIDRPDLAKLVGDSSTN
jgi:hypothetical protein